MKKFYSLFAATLVAGTAMAFSPRQISELQAQATPGAAQKVAMNHEAIAAGLGTTLNAPGRVSTSGANWTVRINVNANRWCDLLVFGEDRFKYSFEELPGYWVTFYTYDDNKEKPTRIFFDAYWPAQAYLDHGNQEDWFLNPGEDDEIFDWERAAEEYGSMEAAQAPASIESMAKVINEEGQVSPLYEFPYGSLPAYYGLFNMQLMGQNSCTYKGTPNLWLKAGVSSGSGSVNMDGAAYLNIKEYDPESMDVTFEMFAPMGTANSQYVVTVKGTVQDEVTESAAVFGFAPINLTPDEVHIFNLGEANADYEMGDGYTLGDFYEDFQPANMYYVAYCTAPLTFEGKYTATTVPVEVAVTGSQAATDEFNYFTSYLTLAANADPENTVPEGLATYTWYKFDKDGFLTNEIGPGFLWPSDYFSPQCNDSQTVLKYMGGDGALFGWNSAPYPDLNEKGELQGVIAKIGFGDKTNGFNSYYKSSLGSLVSVKFTGNVKYHYDSRDYTKVKEVPAVGTSDANTLGVKAISGNESNAPVVGVEYYNFQGVRMANAPQKGLYIVRELKADGTVSVKKVAK